MTPAARIQATIELLGEIDDRGLPADQVSGKYFRKRRFIGSKDRRAISGLLYDVLRHRAKLDWWLAEKTEGGQRARVISGLILLRGQTPDDLAALFDGTAYGPASLTSEERALAARLAGRSPDDPGQPPAVRVEMPAWLYDRLVISLGETCGQELAALGKEAPVDLRVNSLKADRETARERLLQEGLETTPTPWSPLGLRLAERRTLPATGAFKDGWVEVQDEGSQLVALLADARPGMAVADLCAGGGGKTLALGAAMGGKGRLVALDRDTSRLAKAEPRLRRAGLTDVETIVLGSGVQLGPLAGQFDRVLVDAPCSGSGAWRRSPDARWRLTPEMLDGFAASQDEVLGLGAGLVRPGGRLIYATCSLLREENEARCEAFLSAHPEFRPLPVREGWSDILDVPYPEGEGSALQLTPSRHGTDGFYVAVFLREA